MREKLKVIKYYPYRSGLGIGRRLGGNCLIFKFQIFLCF